MSFSSERAQLHITPISYTFPPRIYQMNILVQSLSASEWPLVPALLIIDSFTTHLRHQVLEKATTHHLGVWVLI